MMTDLYYDHPVVSETTEVISRVNKTDPEYVKIAFVVAICQ